MRHTCSLWMDGCWSAVTYDHPVAFGNRNACEFFTDACRIKRFPIIDLDGFYSAPQSSIYRQQGGNPKSLSVFNGSDSHERSKFADFAICEGFRSLFQPIKDLDSKRERLIILNMVLAD